jgi:hypothetical protein
MVPDRFRNRAWKVLNILLHFPWCMQDGTNSCPFKHDTTTKLTVVTLHLVLSVATIEKRVDK